MEAWGLQASMDIGRAGNAAWPHCSMSLEGGCLPLYLHFPICKVRRAKPRLGNSRSQLVYCMSPTDCLLLTFILTISYLYTIRCDNICPTPLSSPVPFPPIPIFPSSPPPTSHVVPVCFPASFPLALPSFFPSSFPTCFPLFLLTPDSFFFCIRELGDGCLLKWDCQEITPGGEAEPRPQWTPHSSQCVPEGGLLVTGQLWLQ